MKATILEIIILLVSSLALYLLFLKFVVHGGFKKYKYEITNKSAIIFSIAISICFLLIYSAILDPILRSYLVMKMNISEAKLFWTSFIPLVGQYVLLVLGLYFILKAVSQQLHKRLFNYTKLRESIAADEKNGIILFSFIFLSITVLVRFFIVQIAISMIPVSQSIF